MTFTLDGNGPFKFPSAPDERMPKFPLGALDLIEQFVPELTRVGPQHWRTPEADDLGFPELLFRYPELNDVVPGVPPREPRGSPKRENSSTSVSSVRNVSSSDRNSKDRRLASGGRSPA